MNSTIAKPTIAIETHATGLELIDPPNRAAGWYNGFSPSQRTRTLLAMNLLLANGALSPAKGPCDLCGDPHAQVFYHSEDYSEPYTWVKPAVYCLCRLCHLHRIHMRFAWPLVWTVHLAHVRRGGYGSDIKNPEVKRQLTRYRHGIENGEREELPFMRPYTQTIGQEWFAALSMDPRSRAINCAEKQALEVRMEEFKYAPR